MVNDQPKSDSLFHKTDFGVRLTKEMVTLNDERLVNKDVSLSFGDFCLHARDGVRQHQSYS